MCHVIQALRDYNGGIVTSNTLNFSFGDLGEYFTWYCKFVIKMPDGVLNNGYKTKHGLFGILQ